MLAESTTLIHILVYAHSIAAADLCLPWLLRRLLALNVDRTTPQLTASTSERWRCVVDRSYEVCDVIAIVNRLPPLAEVIWLFHTEFRVAFVRLPFVWLAVCGACGRVLAVGGRWSTEGGG